MIISFAGHSFVPFKNEVKKIVAEKLRHLVANSDFLTCYLGGYGEFDEICAAACRELKKEYCKIELVYVTPYMSLSTQEKIKKNESCNLYDSSIYPPLENVLPRFAIAKRNEWMMTNSDIIIAYVNHNYGGAYKSLKVAKRNKKTIINVCDFL